MTWSKSLSSDPELHQDKQLNMSALHQNSVLAVAGSGDTIISTVSDEHDLSTNTMYSLDLL